MHRSGALTGGSAALAASQDGEFPERNLCGMLGIGANRRPIARRVKAATMVLPDKFLPMAHSQHHRATDQEIQKWVAREQGFIPQSFWIAHCKELFGIAAAADHSRHDWQACPIDKQPAIKQAFRYFGMLNDPQ
jgi:hypothetical protein